MKIARILLVLFLIVLAAYIGHTSVHAAKDDFTISNYDMKLAIDRDAEQRSTLRTTETITAEFPQTNQNHGIERAIPTTNNGHSTDLHIVSVQDASGKDLPYSTYDSNDNTVVRVGDKDRFVSGTQTYVLIYTQRNVTRYFEDTGNDEFYWDLNGVEWRVPISQFTAEVTMAPHVRSNYERSACYQGQSGARDTCQMSREGDAFRLQAYDLAPGENVTVALGFRPMTFAKYQPSLWERLYQLWIVSLVVTAAVSVVLLIWLVFRWQRDKNRTNELGTIIPEYLPPKDASVTASAKVLDSPRAVFAAQLIDFAVRHYIKVFETKAKSFWSTAEYTIEITKDTATLRAEEQELLGDIFDGKLSVGEKLEMKSLQNNTKLYRRMQDNPKKLQEMVRGEYGLREKRKDARARYTKLGWILLASAGVTVSPFLFVLALIFFLCGYGLWSLTDKGLALRRYLDGLKLYIDVAEEDRLKILQSPEGAKKTGITLADQPAKLVKLYEKVLPFAILFGQEKEWGAQLGKYYEQIGGSPSWYSGTDANVFNAVVFSNAVSSFTSASTYASTSSSSSGGSSSGGFSGGGGGGGGGGGW